MKDVRTTTRDITELNPLVQIMLNEALRRIKTRKINPLIIETYRPKERQYYLYGEGRSISQCVTAGMPRKYAEKYARLGNQCTWTLNSIHIKRCAVDIVPMRNKIAIWNSNDEQTKQIIKIMSDVGFEAGANWKNSPDSPHFQVKGISGKVFSKKNTNEFVTKLIQKQLKKAGFYNREIDGDWDKATIKAIKKWKKSLGWARVAKINRKALKKLYSY